MIYTAVIYRDKKDPKKKGFVLYFNRGGDDTLTCISHKISLLKGELPVIERAKRSELENIFPDCEILEIDSLIEIAHEFDRA